MRWGDQNLIPMYFNMVEPPRLELGIGRVKVCCDNHFTTIPDRASTCHEAACGFLYENQRRYAS